MKFSRIFKETKLIWPREIFIGDGELRSDGGGYFPTLSRVWDEAEVRSEKWSDWHQLMVWCIFGGFHRLARETLENGGNTVYFTDIDKRYVEAKFRENLFSNGAGYGRQMRRAYTNDLKP